MSTRLGINVVRLTRPFTGVGRYIECLLRRWARRGTPFDEVVLYAPAPIRSDLAQFPLESYSVRVTASAAPDPIWEWRSLRQAADEVDVLFCPSYTIPVGYRGPCAVSYLGPAYNAGLDYQALRAAAYDRLHRYSARTADHVFVCSKAVRERVVGAFGVPQERVSVMYLAASDLFAPVEDRSAVRDVVEKHTGSSAPYLLYVGKLSGRHFIPELLEGYAAAARKNQFPHRLVLAGPDTLGYDVPAYARRLGMEERIHWTPFVPHHELPALYSAAEGFVFPTCEAEGFGIPVLEAMACGVPVISVDQGSISEFARGSALLVAEPERGQLCNAIEQLMTDENLRRRLRAAGFETARRITWEFTADKTMDKLWEIARRPRSSRR